MATKKKRTKPAPVGNLTAANIAKLDRKISANHAELIGIVNEFKEVVNSNFRIVQESLADVVGELGKLLLSLREADRARLDTLEAELKAQAERLATLERKAS